MTAATYIMMVLVLGFYWGGFILFACKAARADATDDKKEEDA
ncbi:MAG: hypothetical protein QGH15_17020 [Kiritimatiellia bacterium]|jgi:hypothetical protein|nr:hypothetical protein [Kiritimatiellia bacterium]